MSVGIYVALVEVCCSSTFLVGLMLRFEAYHVETVLCLSFQSNFILMKVGICHTGPNLSSNDFISTTNMRLFLQVLPTKWQDSVAV